MKTAPYITWSACRNGDEGATGCHLNLAGCGKNTDDCPAGFPHIPIQPAFLNYYLFHTSTAMLFLLDFPTCGDVKFPMHLSIENQSACRVRFHMGKRIIHFSASVPRCTFETMFCKCLLCSGLQLSTSAMYSISCACFQFQNSQLPPSRGSDKTRCTTQHLMDPASAPISMDTTRVIEGLRRVGCTVISEGKVWVKPNR